MTGPLRHDPNHLPFLAQAAPVHGEKRPVKNTWQSFKARQARIQEQRDLEMQAGVGSSAREWQHKPKGPAYWKKVGEEMEAKKGAMTKVWSKATL